ncbi:hypothetical protein [Dubosiella newyorkensis]|uniref:hypothetical protein n=1 Tax=Dubosiella newyorkensis TaxID=1862672 RepID=UPI003F661073
MDQEKKSAEQKIADGQKKIDDLKAMGLLDRDSFYSYRDYEACDRSYGWDSLLSFLFFFFLVAALVCMTTDERMVRRTATESGTLKALGYSTRSDRVMKYCDVCFIGKLLARSWLRRIGMFVFPLYYFLRMVQYIYLRRDDPSRFPALLYDWR